MDLITLAEYKAYLGVSSTTNDVQYSSIISKVSALVKTVCRRSFVDYIDDNKIEVFKRAPLDLKEYPVLQVAAVESSSDYGKTYTTLSEFDDYVVDSEIGQVLLLNEPYTSAYMPNAFRVTYTAGFEELPMDLKLAVMDLVTYYVRNDGAVHSNRNPGSNTIQIDYVTNSRLPAHISRVLDLYMANYN